MRAQADPGGAAERDMPPDPGRPGYSAWFLRAIPTRIAALAGQVTGTASFEGWMPDYTAASLDVLGTWLARHVTERPLSDHERKALEGRAPRLPGVASPRSDLDPRTRALCIDVGMYLGQALTRGRPDARWDPNEAGPRDIHCGQPVVQVGTYKGRLNPVHVVTVVAYRIADGNATGGELRELYEKWLHPERIDAEVDATLRAAGIDPDEVRRRPQRKQRRHS